MGWVTDPNSENNIVGTTDLSKRLEAVQVRLADAPHNMTVCYQVYVQDYGWMEQGCNGFVAGTTGEKRRVEAIKIWLIDAPQNVHLQYRAHIEDIGWLSWQSNGETAGTTGQGKRMEALNVKICRPDNNYCS